MLIAFALVSTIWGGATRAAEHVAKVGDDAALRRALAEARAGSRIVIAPGTYRPGVHVAELRGTAEAPIVVEGADAKDKPVFEGGIFGMQFSDCAYLTLRNLALRGQSGNGINIDDAGTFDTPAHHITLDGLHVSEIGPKGNRDGIKLSGVDDLVVRGCTVEGWAGQAIDMVGCHRVLVERCAFRGKAGFDQQIAVQAKGGSSDVAVRNCTFLNVGQRGVNLGGSTGLKLFRPPGVNYEAKDVTVEGCRFVGGLAPVAFVGVDGAVVRYNTIYRPERWIVRILQENTAEAFVPSRGGRLERNLVVFDSRLRFPINIGGKTEPKSFRFKENFWFAEDDPRRSRPQLPTVEEGGTYGVDPKVTLDKDGVPAVPDENAARGYGADALPSLR
jgi:hypothetical protein